MSTFFQDLIRLNPNTGIKLPSRLENAQNIVTPELRALLFPFTDPLSLNFKILLPHEPSYGLLAKEVRLNANNTQTNNLDSALSYLKRIGEEERYIALRKWISVFYDLVKNWDFLILDVEGLTDVFSKPQPNMYEDNVRITLKIKETVEMRVQSLISTYRHIVFDEQRGCYVLPENLRRFTFGILVFSSGYFLESIYGEESSILTSPTRNQNILPTISKLDKINDLKDIPRDGTTLPFVNQMVFINNAMLNVAESGNIFDSVSNNPAQDPVTNNLTFDYHFADTAGTFNSVIGAVDLSKLFTTMAVANKLGNLTNPRQLNSLASMLDNGFRDNPIANIDWSNWRNSFVDSWKGFGSQFLDQAAPLLQRRDQMIGSWINNISKQVVQLTDPNLLRNLTMGSLVKLMTAGDRMIFEKLNIRDLDRMMSSNFTERAISGLDNIENRALQTVSQFAGVNLTGDLHETNLATQVSHFNGDSSIPNTPSNNAVTLFGSPGSPNPVTQFVRKGF
jgi:hypothetical protein